MLVHDRRKLLPWTLELEAQWPEVCLVEHGDSRFYMKALIHFARCEHMGIGLLI